MSAPASENKEIQFALDGQSVCARPKETVLGVAKRMGIDIPTLCHHEAVAPYGKCRLCVVEVSGAKRSRLFPSCIYIPHDGDKIETNTDRVRCERGSVLEQLIARCPSVESIRVLAREYGVEEPRFSDGDSASNERCILCGLCVRVCKEVVGAQAIGYSGSGMERTVTAENASECVGCTACVAVCPTGALHYEDVDGERIMKEWNTRVPLTPCGVCGRPFATNAQLALVRERLSLPEELVTTCPSCRSREFRGALVRSVGAAMWPIGSEEKS